MSVTKMRLSGLLAMKRTRLSPCAATLIAKPSRQIQIEYDLPLASAMRCGTSLRARGVVWALASDP